MGESVDGSTGDAGKKERRKKRFEKIVIERFAGTMMSGKGASLKFVKSWEDVLIGAISVFGK